ncbi:MULTISPECIES: DUF3106 domain-containing protein [Luteimonas]|uniref:DUF3106 domain-containing protein n=1 Tax=Luteimonas TaxID=83614 RepID=UPI001E3B22DA|nr:MULTISPECIES: DUF3106 domain-containing protein [Luteimonas]
MSMPCFFSRPLLLAAVLTMATAAHAGPPAATTAPLPAWDQLDAAQRAQLVAPVRERFNNSDAEGRAKMLDHARRWAAMTPEQRVNARHGMHRWKNLPPEQRHEARALYEKLKTLSDTDRAALRERWRGMTPEQRRQWAADNPPPAPSRDRTP